MLHSIIKNKTFRLVFAAIVWLAVWEFASWMIGSQVLLASPCQTARTWFGLLFQAEFWQTLLSSLARILIGFCGAMTAGVLLAVLASISEWIKTLLHPMMILIKSTPVASFIIIVLLWFGSIWLASIISFLMVLPVIYTNVLQGIETTDRKLLEMAQVFKLSANKRISAIYLTHVMPFMLSALSVSSGLAWKSGVAAEVIGLPNQSIGEKLYQAKLFLDSANLIAWTITIIIISFVFEKLMFHLAKSLQNRIES
jgi:NitT/TauT family transport system permease protein